LIQFIVPFKCAGVEVLPDRRGTFGHYRGIFSRITKLAAAETEIQRVDFGLEDVQTDAASRARSILKESDVVWL
jgi:hypothetical protein